MQYLKLSKPGNPDDPSYPRVDILQKKISEFVSSVVQTLPSYVKNTTHLLNKLQGFDDIPRNALLVTLDVSSLYTNIPTTEGIDAYRKLLDGRSDKSVPTESLCDLMRMILTMSNFVFNDEHFIQQHGTALGTRMAQLSPIFLWKSLKGKHLKVM